MFLGFIPLLALLLPRRVEAVAGDGAIVLLSQLLLVGAVVASAVHIVAGAASDRWLLRHGDRRGLIGWGVGALLANYILFAFAATPLTLLLGIVAFQAALNLGFAPMGALLADYVPDARKGIVSGGLGLALPLSGFAISLLGWASDRDAAWPFLVVGVCACLLVLPLLLRWRQVVPPLLPRPAAGAALGIADLLRGDFRWAFVARALVQLGASVLLTYLFLYVDSVASGTDGFPAIDSSEGVAIMALVANLVALLAAPLAGRWSDRLRRRKGPLILVALTGACALAILATAPDWRLILLAHALFSISLAAFLAIDGALVAEIVADSPRRGALLGVMNLTNTLPGIVAPIAALVLASEALTGGTMRWLLGIAALASVGAALALGRLRTGR